MLAFNYTFCASLNPTNIYAKHGFFAKQTLFGIFLFRVFCLFFTILLFCLRVVLSLYCKNNLNSALNVVCKLSLLALYIYQTEEHVYP